MSARKKAVKKTLATAEKATTAAARRCEELLSLIARRKARIAEDFYEIGVALREIRKKKLHVAVGYDNFGALLAARKVMSVRSADKLIEIVDAVPRAKATELGAEKAYALARLVAATPELDSVESVLDAGVKVGGRRKSVARLSSREIADTAKAVRPKKADPAEAGAHKAARALQAAVRAAGGRGAKAVARKDGRAWVVELTLAVAVVDTAVAALKRS